MQRGGLVAAKESPEDEQCDANDDKSIGYTAADMPARGTEAEMVALAVPKKQSGWSGNDAEQPEVPMLGAVAEHFAAVADVAHGAEANVEAVGEEAEAGEEAEEEGPVLPECRSDGPEDQRGGDAEDGAGPDDQQRVRVFGQVGAGDRERVQYDFFNAASSELCAEDVAGLVDDLHAEPGGEEGGGD